VSNVIAHNLDFRFSKPHNSKFGWIQYYVDSPGARDKVMRIGEWYKADHLDWLERFSPCVKWQVLVGMDESTEWEKYNAFLLPFQKKTLNRHCHVSHLVISPNVIHPSGRVLLEANGPRPNTCVWRPIELGGAYRACRHFYQMEISSLSSKKMYLFCKAQQDAHCAWQPTKIWRCKNAQHSRKISPTTVKAGLQNKITRDFWYFEPPLPLNQAILKLLTLDLRTKHKKSRSSLPLSTPPLSPCHAWFFLQARLIETFRKRNSSILSMEIEMWFHGQMAITMLDSRRPGIEPHSKFCYIVFSSKIANTLQSGSILGRQEHNVAITTWP